MEPAKLSDNRLAQENWQRYRYGILRGHRTYTKQARICDRMYLGGGRQWDPVDKALLDSQGRPAYEFNEVKPALNAAIGYQINNRMDISFRPRGAGTDQAKADMRSKITKQIADQCHLHWKETEVFADGLIEQRGYFDVRVEFDHSMQGNICVTVLDPMDVIPDPDSKTYEPTGWADVIVTRWMTLEEIEDQYGKRVATSLAGRKINEADFGGNSDDEGEERSKFGMDNGRDRAWDLQYTDEAGITRVRVIDRQYWKRQLTSCLLYPRTGDLKAIESMLPDVVAQHVAQGAVQTRTMMRRVGWRVTTYDELLQDSISPYDGFTVIPYFPFFRRGQTSGLVDDAVGPQQALNKGISQFVHIINTSANSGWVVEENSLTNMKTEDLETKGAQTGLVVEYRKGSAKPEKIKSNDVPQGIDRLIDRATAQIREATVPEAMRGLDGPERSGIAIQSKEHAAMTQLALPLDNLGRTRHMMAERFRDLETQFYTEERVFRITEQDPRTGKPVDSTIVVNQWDEITGTYMNDLTEGDYDVVVSEQPTQATFENSQFNQALEMRKVGVAIPDTVMVQHSTLTRKDEILDQMASEQGDPTIAAKVELLNAQTRKTAVEAVNKSVEAMYSATQAGNQIAMLPAVAPLADKLLRSAGFEDADEPPIVPNLQPTPGVVPMDGSGLPPAPVNTNPLTPANPAVGMKSGIETLDQPAGA